jgi:hypothetical protein
MNQLEIRFSRTNRAEIFTRSVSLQDHSSLKISAQGNHSKWQNVSKGGGALKTINLFAPSHNHLHPFNAFISYIRNRAEICIVERLTTYRGKILSLLVEKLIT